MNSNERPLPVVSIGLILLMGLSWIVAFFAVGEASKFVQWIFFITCGSQGLFIFLFFVLFNRHIRQLYCIFCRRDSFEISTTVSDMEL